MAPKGGLFAMSAPPEASGGEGEDDDYAMDMMPMDEEEPSTDPEGGPFYSYAATVFDDSLSVEERSDALREALMTLIEEGKPV